MSTGYANVAVTAKSPQDSVTGTAQSIMEVTKGTFMGLRKPYGLPGDPSSDIFWPEVSRFYSDCTTDEQMLKQRIRRAFEKLHLEHEEHFELAELIYQKLKPFAVMRQTPRGLND
jgi:hypothetical protein